MSLHLKNEATFCYVECEILFCYAFETLHHDKHEES